MKRMTARLAGLATFAGSLVIGAMPAAASFDDGVVHLTGSNIQPQCSGGMFFHGNGTVACSEITEFDLDGTAGDDVISFNSANPADFPNLVLTMIDTLGGNDSVFGSWGRDVIDTGTGNDHVTVLGLDTVDTGDGDDSVEGFGFAARGVGSAVNGDMGAGNDHLAVLPMVDSTIDGYPMPGDGYVWYSETDDWWVALGSVEEAEVYGGFGHQEVYFTPSTHARVIGPDGCCGLTSILDIRSRPWGAQHVGSHWLYSVQGFQPVDLVNDPNGDNDLYNDFRLGWYIPAVYQQFLGRDPDDDGGAYWHRAILRGELGFEDGINRTQMIASLLRLPEHATLAVEDEYDEVLDRSGEAAGVQFWSDFLQHGAGLDPLRSQLYGSPEYFHTHGNDTVDGFLDAIYQDVLHREPDAGGRAYWTQRIAAVGRIQVALDILFLPEPVGVRISDLYQDVLGRVPAPAEVQFWRSIWQHDGEFTFLATAAGSDEYEELVAPADYADPFYWPEPLRSVGPVAEPTGPPPAPALRSVHG